MTPAHTARIGVLHVDDDPEFGALAAEYLEREDDRLSVDTVTDPTEGLAILRESEIDCVLSDYEMTDYNGLEFLRAVRTTHPTVPFIFFTSRRSEEISRTVLSGEATQYLQKGAGTEQYAVLATRISDAAERYRLDRDRLPSLAETEAAADGIEQFGQGVEEPSPLVEDV